MTQQGQVQSMLEVRQTRKELGVRRLITPPRRGVDSPVKRVLFHAILIFAALIAVFPVVRVFSTALRPGNNSTQQPAPDSLAYRPLALPS